MAKLNAKRSSLKSRLLRGGTLISVGRLLAHISTFLAQVMLARACLTTADFGVYMVTNSLVQIAAVVAVFGVPPIVMRTLRESLPTNRTWRAVSAIQNGCVIMLVTVLGTAVAVAVGIYWLRPESFGDRSQLVALVVGIWIVLSSVNQLISQLFTGNELYARSILLGGEGGGLVPNVILMLAAAALTVRGQTDLLVVFAVNLAGLFVAAAFSWRQVWATFRGLRAVAMDHPGCEQKTADGQDADIPNLRWMASQSSPVMMRSLLRICMAQLDVVFTAAFLSAPQIAAYGAARSIVRLIASPLRFTNVAVSPFVPELNASGDKAKLQMLLRAAATTAGLPSFLCFLVLIVAPALVLRLIFGPDYEQAAMSLRILAGGSLAFVAVGGCGMVLLMTGHQKVSLITSTVIFLLQIVITPALIKAFGMVGAATATASLMIIRSTTTMLLVKFYVGVWSAMTFSKRQISEYLRTARRGKGKRSAMQAANT